MNPFEPNHTHLLERIVAVQQWQKTQFFMFDISLEFSFRAVKYIASYLQYISLHYNNLSFSKRKQKQEKSIENSSFRKIQLKYEQFEADFTAAGEFN